MDVYNGTIFKEWNATTFIISFLVWIFMGRSNICTNSNYIAYSKWLDQFNLLSLSDNGSSFLVGYAFSASYRESWVEVAVAKTNSNWRLIFCGFVLRSILFHNKFHKKLTLDDWPAKYSCSMTKISCNSITIVDRDIWTFENDLF